MTVLSYLRAPKTIAFPKDQPAPGRGRYRRIPFSGTMNFRDLGGYPASDGCTVKWGVLYRSDHLHRLTDGDLNQLARLSLDRVIDFRAAFEKARAPDRLPAGASIRRVEIPILDAVTGLGNELRQKIAKGKPEDIDPAKLLTEANVQFATTYTPQYRQFVHELLSANGKPVLLHCVAGKDRAGFAAAITLRIIGVPEGEVMRDYLLSGPNTLAAHRRGFLILRLARGAKAAGVARALSDTKPEYLGAAFTAIDAAYGSFEGYVHSGLGLSGPDIQWLRANLLDRGG